MTKQESYGGPISRKVLLAVTGLSPQVVTETLYALAVAAEHPWMPDEIHVVTTGQGAEQARLNLLSERPGWFHQLCRDYRLAPIRFDETHIHAIQGRDGKVLDDIRNPEDNDAAADFITEVVRNLTQDPDSAVHASIAGGRKTMGFYLGYALSLYGRPQDQLSHVLVSAPFESHPQFYYPTPYESVIHTTQDGRQRTIDARDARITLADIPFVRLREGLPGALLDGQARFSDAVAEAQKALPPISLCLNPETREVSAGGETFMLRASEFALYWLLAERAKHGRPGIHWTDDGLAGELLGFYGRLVNVASGEYDRATQAYRHGLSKDNLDPAKTKINKAIRTALGERRAQPYLIASLETISGSRYRRYGLAIEASAITVLPESLQALQQPGD